jgi:hypothetical protein
MSSPRESSRSAAALDLGLVLAAIAIAWALTRWVIYPALEIPDYAPYILRPITGFLAAWCVLHWRGSDRSGDPGSRPPRRLKTSA